LVYPTRKNIVEQLIIGGTEVNTPVDIKPLVVSVDHFTDHFSILTVEKLPLSIGDAKLVIFQLVVIGKYQLYIWNIPTSMWDFYVGLYGHPVYNGLSDGVQWDYIPMCVYIYG